MRCSLLCVALMTGGVCDAATATFVVVIKDAAGVGLNDSTAFTPVGGNTATTLGQARLNVIKEAGRIWGDQISSSQPIIIDAKFDAQTCTATSGTLASAGPFTYFTGGNLPLANALYPAALADALSSSNVNQRDDINMTINSNVGTGSSCLAGRSFYLGFDHQNGSNIDLLNTLLHEIAHGLGFVSLTDQTGASLANNGQLSVFDQFLYFETLAKFWPQMTAAERATASTSNGALVWNATAVNGQTSRLSSGSLSSPGGHLRLYAPTTWDDGSSVSHWDKVVTIKNTTSVRLLMEPFLSANPGLTDLTGCALRDIGWAGTRCPDIIAARSQILSAADGASLSFTLQGIELGGSGLLTYSVVSPPLKGTYTANGSLTSANGVPIAYTPTAPGADSLGFQVSDGADVSPAATITIDHPPVVTPFALSAVTAVATNVVLAASDSDADSLNFTLVSGPANGTLSGTVPNLTYTSNAGFVGTDTLTYRANDGYFDSAVATVTITVGSPQPAVSSGGGGGGGGVLAWYELALLASLAMRQARAGFGARRSVQLNS